MGFGDNRRKHDHIGQFNFRVEIDGVTQAAFKAVEGLDSETEVIEYQDGDDIILRKRPGRTKYSNIICKRGYISTDELWLWRKAVMEGKVDRKSGSIILLNDNGQEVMRYNFFEAWPAKWKGFTLDGKGTDVAVEEIEFVVERWERMQGGA
ncbi:MAG: phage tail protein [Myxococcales bacterium]|nr:phage tail protein [Myxococcales bacterium]MCB9523804.1 phage tail protein [Myxococcales bacterium]